jgi:hypothetical protein
MREFRQVFKDSFGIYHEIFYRCSYSLMVRPQARLKSFNSIFDVAYFNVCYTAKISYFQNGTFAKVLLSVEFGSCQQYVFHLQIKLLIVGGH